MRSQRPPPTLLVELFSPPATYLDLPDTLARLDPGVDDWERRVGEVLDSLHVEVEFDRRDREAASDLGYSASISHRSRNDAARMLASTGEALVSAIARVRSETRDAMLSDMRRLLTPLMQPENADLRDVLVEVPSQWMSCVAASNALPQFIDLVAAEWPVEGLRWFLRNVPHQAGCSSQSGVGVVEMVEAVSWHTLAPSPVKPPLPDGHAREFLGWSEQSAHWKGCAEVAGVRLAHELVNPAGVVATFLASATPDLEWGRLRWATAIRHVLGVPVDEPLVEAHVATFMKVHAGALAVRFPGRVQGAERTPGPHSMVRLADPQSLEAITGIIASATTREEVLAEMEKAVIASRTSPVRAHRRNGRL